MVVLVGEAGPNPVGCEATCCVVAAGLLGDGMSSPCSWLYSLGEIGLPLACWCVGLSPSTAVCMVQVGTELALAC